jgi:hypothetical protein
MQQSMDITKPGTVRQSVYWYYFISNRYCNSMVSSAIWKKTCTNEFLKDDQNCTNPKDECNLNWNLWKAHECMFLEIARETILLLINNIMKSLHASITPVHSLTPFQHCFHCLLTNLFSLCAPCTFIVIFTYDFPLKVCRKSSKKLNAWNSKT